MRTHTLAALAGGLLTVLVFMATVFAPRAQAQPVSWAPLQLAGVAAPPRSELYQTPPVSCTIVTTPTVGKLGNQDFSTAFLLSNVSGLSLISIVGVPPSSPPIQVPTIP